MYSRTDLYQQDIEHISSYGIDWQKLSGRSVLITGATGLIGTVLVDAFMYKNAQGANVRVYALARDADRVNRHFADYVDDDNFVAIGADVSEKLSVEGAIDFVIHLAGNTHPKLYASEPISTIRTIVEGTHTILNFAYEKNVQRVINASSVEVYGENRGDVEKFTEKYSGYIDCNTLRAGYPEGKRLSEALSQAYITEKKLDVISARFGRVYGAPFVPSDTKSTSQFIRSAVRGDDILLKSEGKQEYSYVYVADAVTALLVLLTKGACGHAYNIAGDEVITLREVAQVLSDINGKKILFEASSEAEQKGYSVVEKALMDAEKLKQLGWNQHYSLKDGLQRTVSILKGTDHADSEY